MIKDTAIQCRIVISQQVYDMNFQDIGIIIAKKPLKENSSILSLFTKQYGLHSGVIRETSKQSRITNQIGNLVDFRWKARLIEHIGTIECELIKSYSSHLLHDKTKLYAFNSIISVIKIAFYERENQNNFYLILKQYLDKLIINFSFLEYIKIELKILEQSGYGLQLNKCAVTDKDYDLSYISPKSGKAISTDVGLPYANKLLILPKFLSAEIDISDITEKKQALAITTYFFNRYFFRYTNQSFAREVFVKHITN